MSSKTTRVAIIGAGPCGLSMLHALEPLAASGRVQVVCYEHQEAFGGLWRYTWRTGTDKHGDPVHGSMYRDLWSNGPKECLELADYTFDEHFGKLIGSFPPRAVLFDYLAGRVGKENLERFVEYNTMVESIRCADDGTFQVDVRTPGNAALRSGSFDKVIVAVGHFSVPYVPDFKGIESFPGRVLHSHDFRHAEEFVGQRVLIVGSSFSAEDVALQTLKFGAKSVTATYRTKAMGFKWPDGIDERPLLTDVRGRTVSFSDGSEADYDAIILCTGYLLRYPFFADSDNLRLVSGNRLYPRGLYKGVVWARQPNLFYMGMQNQLYSFSMFDAQAFFIRAVIGGSFTLPSSAGMQLDMDEWASREQALCNSHEAIDFQTAYVLDLTSAAGYAHNLDVGDLFHKWDNDKRESIIKYRDVPFRSIFTGTLAIDKGNWWEKRDDSLEAFLSK